MHAPARDVVHGWLANQLGKARGKCRTGHRHLVRQPLDRPWTRGFSMDIRQLEGQAIPFRAACFSERAAELARARRIEAVTIDYNHPDTLRAAFDACETLFLLAPNALNQTELEVNAVKAAKAAGVRHIVKQSVLGAAEEDYSLARIHRPVEKAIETSGLAWTFLRPNRFMQNVVTFMAQTIRAEDAFYSASDEARISHIDVRDIAAVTVAALTTEVHERQIYTLTGPEALTYDEMAEELSTALGHAIRHISLPPLDLKEPCSQGGCRKPSRIGCSTWSATFVRIAPVRSPTT